MSQTLFRPLAIAALVAALTAASPSFAQENSSPFGLDRLFGNSNRPSAQTSPQVAQGDDADMVLKVDRLEAEIRRLTGQIEQLQYRNQQLETQLQRQQGTPPPVTAAPNSMTNAAARPQVQTGPITAPPAVASAPPPVVASAPPAASRGRGDAFDPNQNPNAPGAPHALGGGGINPVLGNQARPEPPVGVPGGREPGAPFDLSTLSNVPNQQGAPAQQAALPNANSPLPAPPARNPNATGAAVATLPPTASPKDQYDLGYGYVLRKDYALAEDALGTFLKKYPTDRHAADAQFWLGESLFQRQRYDTAAEQFLQMSTKHAAHPKAAEALLRLGESLAALKQKEMACATLAEVGRKYPRASAGVKQGVEREQKRVHC